MSGTRRRASLVAVLGAVAAGCVAPPAAAPVPGVDPLAATTAGVAAMAGRAVEAAAARGATLDTTRGGPPPTATSRPDGGAASPQPRGPNHSAAPGLPAAANAALVDDVGAALSELERRRAAARADVASPASDRALSLARLGLWDEAGRLVAAERAAGRASVPLAVAEADLLLRRHRYRDAERVIAAVGAGPSADRASRARLAWMRARLHIARWQLDSAAASLAPEMDGAPPVYLTSLLGRVSLLKKDYDGALRVARALQAAAPDAADGYLLEADVHFWKEDLDAAEAPLRAALERDPFDPDARSAYGYAIWRRVDARQLPAMAAQWNLALAIDPLHYVTHWHFGNGHTDQTFADYAHPSDSAVRLRLRTADAMIARGRPLDAVRESRRVERDFPESVLPAMLRGSAFYMAYGMDLERRLDSAQATFAGILARKRNYGPAHNGLAAVVKQRQFTVLAAYDSLERAIAAEPLPPDPAFDSVFADLRYYPGDRVRKMARQQLGPSVAYLPMLARQDRRFRVPPLHKDLAEAMRQPFFRGATTFDNRQWMDIRGVGSGAAAIEYVERGSHQERNVLNHEYVHLFHGRAFTDAENRRVRQLYWDAMRERRTLDYYAANNESEFLAQAYEAYLSPVKVHPLNHKAMNTRAELASKDPATFSFIDSLVGRQRAYLAGDSAVFRSNWAQAYAYLADSLRALHLADSARSSRAADSVRLAGLTDERRRRSLADSVARRADSTRARLLEAAALLDTALRWDDRYVPALLSYATLRREERRFDEAERWLARALALDSAFAPTYAERATLVARRAEAEHDTSARVLAEQAALYERALALETDLANRASLNGALRGLHARHARYPEALRVADAYVAGAPMVSTYLRDRRDEAAAFAASLRAQAGYAAQVMPFFDSLTALEPQNWGLRQQQVVALWYAGRHDDALRELDAAQRILRAGAGANGGFAALAAEIRLDRGDTAGARRELDAVIQRRTRPSANDRRIVRVLARLGHPDSAERRHATYRDRPDGPADRAEVAYTRGVIAQARGDAAAAEREYRLALADNPYQRHARLRLLALLRRADRTAEAGALVAAARALPLPPGPDLSWRLDIIP